MHVGWDVRGLKCAPNINEKHERSVYFANKSVST